MTRLFLTACAVGLTLHTPLLQPALAQTAETTQTNPTDVSMQNLTAEQFATMAASSNLFEVASSQLALDHGADGDVAVFAQHMIDDHSAAGAEMKTSAEADGLTVPEQLTPEHQAKLDGLATVNVEELATAYIAEQVAAHEEAVALFTAYSASGQEGALRDFAEKTLPTLREHLDEVTTLSKM